MASASPTTAAAPAASAGLPRGATAALRRALAPATTIVGAAVLLALVYRPWYLNYDARYALLWARDLWHGFRPDLTAAFAPTPHPLDTALSSLALPFGAAADQLLVGLVLLSFGALVWLAYRLGTELHSPWVGAVTAGVVLTRPALARDAVLGYQDTLFAALVVGAVLLEARRPRRGAPVLALLAVAGLIRPEAWVLSGLYLLWVWRGLPGRRRLALAGLAACAPALWALGDWLVTGDPLHSLHGTAALAERAQRRRHLDQVPFWTAKYFAFTLREPLVVGVPLGLAFAWRHRRGGWLLPLAVAVALTAVFAAGPLVGLPLIGRYVRTPAVLLALFYGLAVFGWRALPAGPAQRRWRAAGLVALALSVAYLPWQARLLAGLKDRVDSDTRVYGDLRALTSTRTVREAFRACGPLATADHRPVPYVRFWLAGAPGSVQTVEHGAHPIGRLLLVPRRTAGTRRFYGRHLPAAQLPPGFRELSGNHTWAVFAGPGCPSGPA